MKREILGDSDEEDESGEEGDTEDGSDVESDVDDGISEFSTSSRFLNSKPKTTQHFSGSSFFSQTPMELSMFTIKLVPTRSTCNVQST